MQAVIRRVVAEPSLEWWGLARGASFVDAIEAAAGAMPGAAVDLCTFGLGHRDAVRLDACGLRRVMVCRALTTMRSAFDEEKVRAAVGDRLRMSWTHAKFAVVRADDGRALSILTSANATKNTRWESYLVTDCPELARVLLAHLDELDALGSEPFRGSDYYLRVFQRAMARAVSEVTPDSSFAELLGRM